MNFPFNTSVLIPAVRTRYVSHRVSPFNCDARRALSPTDAFCVCVSECLCFFHFFFKLQVSVGKEASAPLPAASVTRLEQVQWENSHELFNGVCVSVFAGS